MTENVKRDTSQNISVTVKALVSSQGNCLISDSLEGRLGLVTKSNDKDVYMVYDSFSVLLP